MKIKTAKKASVKKTVVKATAKCAAKKTTAKVATKTVTFSVHGEKGHTVCLAGEFNNWNPSAKKMAYKARNSVYSTTIKLAPGSYQYKYIIDGTWCADPENINSVANDQGTFNSVIEIK